ncbi:MAG: rhomboid family intramembrane serine protease [Bacillota bacterium]
MIPLRDQIPSQHPPVMTLILIAINLFVFYQVNIQGMPGIEEIYTRYALIPGQFDLSHPLTSITPLVTSTFLHGNLIHLISNMWALWLFGDNVEDRMGALYFLLFYLISGMVAGISHIYVNPTSLIPTVGASGAIAGVMGAYFILYPRARVLTLIPVFIFPWFVDIPAFIYLGFWLLTQLMGATASLAGGAVQIAFWAHVGGFAAGVLLHRLFLLDRTTA